MSAETLLYDPVLCHGWDGIHKIAAKVQRIFDIHKKNLHF